MDNTETENFGQRHKNKSFSEIMAIAYKEEERESIDLFFLEILKYGKNIHKADKGFLLKSKKMLQSLYNNSDVIDKELANYLNMIELALESK
tara:strand:+ start:1319 stop:1594 length:276 start_codon:yes stop_codon:yes gene_type:complete